MMDGNDTRNSSLRRRREMHDRAQTCTVSLSEGTEEYGKLDTGYQENEVRMMTLHSYLGGTRCK